MAVFGLGANKEKTDDAGGGASTLKFDPLMAVRALPWLLVLLALLAIWSLVAGGLWDAFGSRATFRYTA